MSAGSGVRQGTSIFGTAGPGGSIWGYYLAAAFIFAMGMIFLNDFRYALAAQKRWTPAAGRISENKVVCYRSRRSTSYHTYISYSYSANESLYGSRELEVNKQKLYFSEDGAREDLQEHFPIGKNMDVYYNPYNPSESSLGLAGAPIISTTTRSSISVNPPRILTILIRPPPVNYG